ncbi:MAG: flagellar hook-associated protein FlgL [Candidatus Poribacteria bacterium]
MRITNKIIAAQIKETISQHARRLQESQTAIASGKRINKSSDDPVGTTQVIKQRAQIDRIDQLNRNIDDGLGFLNRTDTVLSEVRSQLVRAKEIALAQANGTADASVRDSAVKEVTMILEDVVGLANTEFNGRFIFAGHKTQTQPFQLDVSTVTYHGDEGQIQRQIGFHETIQANIVGSDVFPQVFDTLINLREAVQQNDQGAIQAAIDDLDANIKTTLNTQADVGTRVNRLETQKERLLNAKRDITQILSDTEDVDLAEAITEFSLKQTALQAALESAARIIQPSLLNFLR